MPVGNRHFHALLMKIAPSPKRITHSSMKIKPIETHSLPRKLAYSSMKITRKPHSQQKCNCCAILCNLLTQWKIKYMRWDVIFFKSRRWRGNWRTRASDGTMLSCSSLHESSTYARRKCWAKRISTHKSQSGSWRNRWATLSHTLQLQFINSHYLLPTSQCSLQLRVRKHIVICRLSY